MTNATCEGSKPSMSSEKAFSSGRVKTAPLEGSTQMSGAPSSSASAQKANKAGTGESSAISMTARARRQAGWPVRTALRCAESMSLVFM